MATVEVKNMIKDKINIDTIPGKQSFKEGDKILNYIY